MYITWGETAEFCGRGFSLFSVRMLVKPYHFGVNWPTTFAKTKMGSFFTLKFKCNNWYNKILLCNSKNGVIAWCSTNNAQWGFCVFLRTKTCFFSYNPKNGLKKQKKTGGLGFYQPWLPFNHFLWFLLIARSATSHVTISLIGCARRTPRVHVPGIEEVKNYWHLNA